MRLFIWKSEHAAALTKTLAACGRAADGVVARSAELQALVGDGAADAILFVPAESSTRLAKRLHREFPRMTVVATATWGDVDLARAVVEAGATDLLVLGKHLDGRVQTLLVKLDHIAALAEENRRLAESNARLAAESAGRHEIVGTSPAIRRVLEQVERVARIPRPVLVVGERGTGKELVARAIHRASGRPADSLVCVNCAAFDDPMLESELFGHERGAFTGAERLVPGKFELADGGTLFLDEIANMSLAFQRKILRVVEYGVYARVGGTKELRTTARVVAATNADLAERIRAGAFLADLYDRLGFETIRVPPLRERGGDIELLAQHCLARFRDKAPGLTARWLDRGALEALRRYSFPGNVRELRNIIERAAYRDRDETIGAVDLELPMGMAGTTAGTGGAPSSFRERVEDFERRLLSETLAATNGNAAEAARRLGLADHQFRYYAKRRLKT